MGTTIVIVTHDPELAARAQRNVHIVDGVVSDLDRGPYEPHAHATREQAPLAAGASA